jgi:hypothetical protein
VHLNYSVEFKTQFEFKQIEIENKRKQKKKGTRLCVGRPHCRPSLTSRSASARRVWRRHVGPNGHSLGAKAAQARLPSPMSDARVDSLVGVPMMHRGQRGGGRSADVESCCALIEAA